MKFSFIIIVLTFFSCSKPDYYQKQINEYFSENLKDPSSFELIDQSVRELNVSTLIEEIFLYDRMFLSKRKLDIPGVKSKVESLKNKDSVIGLVYKIKYRAKNSFGALGIDEKHFLFNNIGNLIDDCRDFHECKQKFYDRYYKDEFNLLFEKNN